MRLREAREIKEDNFKKEYVKLCKKYGMVLSGISQCGDGEVGIEDFNYKTENIYIMDY